MFCVCKHRKCFLPKQTVCILDGNKHVKCMYFLINNMTIFEKLQIMHCLHLCLLASDPLLQCLSLLLIPFFHKLLSLPIVTVKATLTKPECAEAETRPRPSINIPSLINTPFPLEHHDECKQEEFFSMLQI